MLRAERAAPGLDAWPFVAPAVATALSRVPQPRADPPSAPPAGTRGGPLPARRDAAGHQQRALTQLYVHVSPANAAKLAAAVRGLPTLPPEAGPAPGSDCGARAHPSENGGISRSGTAAAGPNWGGSAPRQWWAVERGAPLGTSAAWLALAVRCVAGAAGDAGDVEHEYDAHARPCLNRLERPHLAALAAWLVLAGPPPLPGAPILARGALPPGLRARAARDAAAALEQALAADAAPSVTALQAAQGKLAVGNGPAVGKPRGSAGAQGVRVGPGGERGPGGTPADSGGPGAEAGALPSLLAELRAEAGWLGVLGNIQQRVALAPGELAAVEAALAGRAQAAGPPGACQPYASAAAGALDAGQGRDSTELDGLLGAATSASSRAGDAPVGDHGPGPNLGSESNPTPDPLAACISGLAAGGCSAAKLLAVAAAALGAVGDGSEGSEAAHTDAEALVAREVAGALSSALRALGAGGAGGAQAALHLEGMARCLATSCAPSDDPGDTPAAETPQGELSPSARPRARAPRNGLPPGGGKGPGSDLPEWHCAVAGMRDAAWAQLLAHAASRQGGAGASDAAALRLLGELALDAGARGPSMCVLLSNAFLRITCLCR